ncbi:copper chaperone PCu(A)C [Stella sp.]|uniref:copper chaperone PCu(A)C n=1 Tax=Stella sp. TaxID=2912054 RepID=UPI0035AF1A52
MKIATLAFALLAAAPALAQAPGVDISAPWARPSAPSARNGAAYLTIENRAAAPDRLLSAAAPVAGTVELHTVVKDGDVMRMRPVATIEIAAGATQKLQPGGYHIMLIDLKAPLKAGDRFPLDLTFEKAGRRQVEVVVGTAPAAGHGKH